MAMIATYPPVTNTLINLVKYTASEHVEQQFQTYMDNFLYDVGLALEQEMTADMLINILSNNGIVKLFFNYIFGGFVTSYARDGQESCIDNYYQNFGHQEPLEGINYLTALNKSRLEVWEVTGINPGVSIEIRPYGSEVMPIAVYEQHLSESLAPLHCLIGRVLYFNDIHYLASGHLPLSPLQGGEVSALTQDLKKALDDDYRQFKKTTGRALTAEEMRVIYKQRHEQLFIERYFSYWVQDLYEQLTLPIQLERDEEAQLQEPIPLPPEEGALIVKAFLEHYYRQVLAEAGVH